MIERRLNSLHEESLIILEVSQGWKKLSLIMIKKNLRYTTTTNSKIFFPKMFRMLEIKVQPDCEWLSKSNNTTK